MFFHEFLKKETTAIEIWPGVNRTLSKRWKIFFCWNDWLHNIVEVMRAELERVWLVWSNSDLRFIENKLSPTVGFFKFFWNDGPVVCTPSRFRMTLDASHTVPSNLNLMLIFDDRMLWSCNYWYHAEVQIG